LATDRALFINCKCCW